LRIRNNDEFVSGNVLGSRRCCTLLETVCACRGANASITQYLVSGRCQEIQQLCWLNMVW